MSAGCPPIAATSRIPAGWDASQRCTIDLLRIALDADAAFLWAPGPDLALRRASDDARGLDSAPVRDLALARSEPVDHDDGTHAWLAAAFGHGARRGALCVAAIAPRAFDDHAVATIRAAAALAETFEAAPRLPLQALVQLSDTMLREAEDTSAATSTDALRAAADSLEAVAGRLRQLSAPAMPSRGPESARILLADDLDLNRRLIADMLSLSGHHVDAVSDGAAAVRAVAAERYDLVLMDMIMPEMDGLTATRAIRALPRPASDVPIVALTANSQPEQLDSCLAAGMNAALTKPMSLDALTSAVAHWTRDRHAA